MAESAVPHPKIVSHEDWLAARVAHLAHEKELTKQLDRLRAERRRLPMEKVSRSYLFEGTHGKLSLLGLFEGRRQLIVYHFMFDPKWEKGCSGCTGYVDALGDPSRRAPSMVWPSAPLHQAHAGATTASETSATIAQVATTAKIPRAHRRTQPCPITAAVDSRSPPCVKRHQPVRTTAMPGPAAP